MSSLKSSLLLISISLISIGIASFFAWRYSTDSTSYAELQTVLIVTTETFGVLLGIITAGLIFTQGEFGELSSELAGKSPDYLTNVLSLEKIQTIEAHLVSLRKTFTELASKAMVDEERNLYEKVVAKISSMFVNFAVLLNLKLESQRLPITSLLVSEMDPNLYRIYAKVKQNIRKEWQLLSVVGQIVNVWEAPSPLLVEKSRTESPLQADIKSSISLLRLKETVDKGSANIRNSVTKALDALSNEISGISKRFHEERIPQLLSQMKNVSIVRGRYFYLAATFITAPLFINLLILPQLTAATVTLFKPIIAITSALSVTAVMFLLLYAYKILNV